MTIMLLIVLVLALALGWSARRAWRDIKAMNQAFEHKPVAPTEHDAWYIEQAIRDAVAEQQWRSRVALNEQRRAQRRGQMEAA